MKPIKFKAVLGVAAVIVAAAALTTAESAKGGTIRNIPPTPHTAPSGTPLADIAASIRLAAKEKGWQITSEEPGVMQATLPIRSHKAMVEIKYDASDFSIDYKDSFNLDYSPDDLVKGPRHRRRTVKGPRIHRNYNIWVRQLADRIIYHAISPTHGDPIEKFTKPKKSTLIADELEKLDSLRQRGVLSDEEFDRQKAKLLAQ